MSNAKRSADDGTYGRTSKASRLRHAVHAQLLAHQAAGELPTSNRFVLYELRQQASPALYGSKSRGKGTGARSEDQNLSDASKWLRDQGIVPWNWLVDETREVTDWQYAATVAEYLADAVDGARIDVWDSSPPPLILCESRTFGGVMKRTLAPQYLCPIGATNGQVGGFLHTDIAPLLDGGDRPVLYVGDLDIRGADIENNTCRVLESVVGPLDWTRVALTEQQAQTYNLTPVAKYDGAKGGAFDAIEVEALGQALVTGILRDALDALLPEPLDDVQVREQGQRDQVRADLTGGDR